MILHLTSSKGLAWRISLQLSPPALSQTRYFQLQLGYPAKFSVCRSVCIFYYFLKECSNLFGNFAGPLKDIIPVVQMHKIIFTPVTLPNKAFWRYFLHIFVFRCFFIFLYFLRTFQLIYVIFLQIFLILLRGLPH